MDDNSRFMPLLSAMQHFQATIESEFVKSAKKHKCYYMKGGIVKIDVQKLEIAINAEFARAQANSANRKTREPSPGRDLGLIEARLTRYPARIEVKKDKIKSNHAAVRAADSPYLKRKLMKDLKKLENELAKMEESYQRDLKRRDEILNFDEGESESQGEE